MRSPSKVRPRSGLGSEPVARITFLVTRGPRGAVGAADQHAMAVCAAARGQAAQARNAVDLVLGEEADDAVDRPRPTASLRASMVLRSSETPPTLMPC